MRLLSRRGFRCFYLFFGAATFLMAILVFVNVYVAVAEIIICTVILGILWKRMEDQYGG